MISRREAIIWARLKPGTQSPNYWLENFFLQMVSDINCTTRNYLANPISFYPNYILLFSFTVAFWHGHENCKYFVVPKTRTKWWLQKINRNSKLDEENFLKLKHEGWKIFCIFECELKGLKQERTLWKILTRLKKLSKITPKWINSITLTFLPEMVDFLKVSSVKDFDLLCSMRWTKQFGWVTTYANTQCHRSKGFPLLSLTRNTTE